MAAKHRLSFIVFAAIVDTESRSTECNNRVFRSIFRRLALLMLLAPLFLFVVHEDVRSYRIQRYAEPPYFLAFVIVRLVTSFPSCIHFVGASQRLRLDRMTTLHRRRTKVLNGPRTLKYVLMSAISRV